MKAGRAMAGLVAATIACVVPVAADEGDGFSTGRRFDARTGEAIYRATCQGCHMADGRGATGAGIYPALAGNPRLASPVYPSVVVLAGRRNMPSFAATLDDAQVAAVVTYVRSHFGNAWGDAIGADDVARLRVPRRPPPS